MSVMASGWTSFDLKLEPYTVAFIAASSWCGLGCRFRTDGRIHHPGLVYYVCARYIMNKYTSYIKLSHLFYRTAPQKHVNKLHQNYIKNS